MGVVQLLVRFARDDSGATAIEYGLIAVLISGAIIGAIIQLRGGLENMYAVIGAAFH